MKRLIYIFCVVVTIFCFYSCESNFIDDVFVQPKAVFEINKTEYNVFESVYFTNKGDGQKFVVYPGDTGHKYNQVQNTGFATASNGKFSYSYAEPGEYTAVWVASSINEDGVVIKDVDSVKINIVAKDGGLDRLSIYRIYRMDDYATSIFYSSIGEFISPDTLLCPILFESWRDATINTIKGKQIISFDLASDLASMYWINNNVETEIKSEGSAYRIVQFVNDGKLTIQEFRVKTVSGYVNNYYVAPVMIPKMTKFEVNGVAGTIKRDLAYYNRYEVDITLPSGTDLGSLVPVFEIMGNDPNLTDGTNVTVTVNDQVQISGVTSINASGKKVEYNIHSTLLGSTNSMLMQEALVTVNFK